MSDEQLPGPEEIVPGIHDVTCRLRESGKRNRVYLDVRDEPILFDAGYSYTTDAVVDGIDAVGTEPAHLVITHGDGDHIGGLDELAARYELETWVPQRTEYELESEPTHRYADGSQIGQYVAVHTPGHAPDNHTLVDEAGGVAITGDAVSGSDRRGLPPGYFTLPPNSVDLGQAEESLQNLLDYEFDVGLVYHGSAVMEDAREKLDRYANPI